MYSGNTGVVCAFRFVLEAVGRSLKLPQQLIYAPDSLLSSFHATPSQAEQMHGTRRSCHSLAVHFATFAGCDFSSHLNRSPSSSRHSERLRMVRIVGEERMRKRKGRAGCGRLVDGLHRHWRDCCGACPWSTVAQYGSDDMLMTSSRYCTVRESEYRTNRRHVSSSRATILSRLPETADKFQPERLHRLLPFLLPGHFQLSLSYHMALKLH